MAPELSDYDRKTKFTVGIGYNYSSFTDKSQLPFTVNELGQPVQNLQIASVDCLPCIYMCQFCADGWIFDPITRGCRRQASKQIVITTLSGDVQPFRRPLSAKLATVIVEGVFKWTIADLVFTTPEFSLSPGILKENEFYNLQVSVTVGDKTIEEGVTFQVVDVPMKRHLSELGVTPD